MMKNFCKSAETIDNLNKKAEDNFLLLNFLQAQ